MVMKEKFLEEVNQSYTFSKKSLTLGVAKLNDAAVEGALVKAPLKMFNRHGLISGATGTGKTKTIQLLAEMLSEAGVPTLLMDVKGDLSGIAAEGASNAKIEERHYKIGEPWQPDKFPVELLTISAKNGVQMRATVIEFGPVLFSRILDLNDTQSGVVSLIFKYCDDHQMPLLDLKDFKKVLQYLTNDGKHEIEKEYGKISTASTGTIMRKIIEIEEQGADKFFGEESFDVYDLMRRGETGRGFINIFRVDDIQNNPRLFSTFMLCLLAEIYSTLAEVGDPDQPELVIFIDEAHLVFNEASKALHSQIETMIKLIRSKGVGVFFCTQLPDDVPAPVLSQLGMKIQHSLRAFTVKDRKNIKMVAENYPSSHYYKVEDLITALGIGEALVTVLNEKGNPTLLAHTLLKAPSSRMDVLTQQEIDQVVNRSQLSRKYNRVIERESAYELLNKKLETAAQIREQQVAEKNKPKPQPGMAEVFAGQVGKALLRNAVNQVARGLFGVLTGKKSRGKSIF